MSEKQKVAVIFGVTGQDGSYLSELLLGKDYEVYGITRRCSVDNTINLKKADVLTHPNFTLMEADISDYLSVSNVFHDIHNDMRHVDEVYNLAAQSHVARSFEQPLATWRINAEGVMNILEAIRRECAESPKPKFYQASTSEMFGRNCDTWPTLNSDGTGSTRYYQNEKTRFAPNSPYAVAKVAAHRLVQLYRESYGMFCCGGILFNHESPRRGEHFVTRKITKYVASLHSFSNFNTVPVESYDERTLMVPGYGRFPKLGLGNMDAKRDWGHAEDYVRGMWMMLQHDKPDDYILATGKSHSVKQFVDAAFASAGIGNWEDCVYVDPKFYRPADVEHLEGIVDKAKRQLGWEPKLSFTLLVADMVSHDIIEEQERVHSAKRYEGES